MTPTQDNLAVRTLVDGLVAGWNAQDGTAFARQFAADADFTNVMGLHAKGRDVIARGHDEIFATLFKGTTLTATVEQSGSSAPTSPWPRSSWPCGRRMERRGKRSRAASRASSPSGTASPGRSPCSATWFPSSGRPPARSNVRSPRRPGAPPSVCDRLWRAGG